MRVITTPPSGVMGGGIYYPINTDFTVWLEFARLIEAKNHTRALKLCYKKNCPDDLNEALYLLLRFFTGNEDGKKTSGEQLLSFSEDEELIYASFRLAYGIDLGNTSLHWWRFLALLKNLGPETPLMRVIAIRAAKLSDIKNPILRRQLLRKKRLFSLKSEPQDAGAVLGELFKEADKCQNRKMN